MNQNGAGGAGGAAPPVVPIQTCKLPPPRSVTMDETRESLSNWLDSAQAFFANDDNYARFVQPHQTWDMQAPNYGFVAEGPATKLRRTAPDVAAALDRFFRAVSGFFPYNFLARRFKESSTSFASMKEMIYTANNLSLNGVSLLQLLEMKRSPEENYYIFYERVRDYCYQHLAGPNLTVLGYNTGANGDTMNLSQANLIALLWLERVDRRLPKMVQIEYGTELRRGDTQLIELIPRIASDIPVLLTKIEEAKIHRVRLEENKINQLAEFGMSELHVDRFARDDRRAGNSLTKSFRGRATQSFNRPDTARGSDKRGNGPNQRTGADRRNQQAHCAHCEHLSKELDVKLHTAHDPQTCRRKRVHIRTFEDQEEASDESSNDREDSEDEGDNLRSALYNQGENLPSLARLSLASSPLTPPLFQVSERPAEKQRACDPGGPCQPVLFPVPASDILSRLSVSPLSEHLSEVSHEETINRIILRIQAGVHLPTKASSPALLGEINGIPFVSVIDSGAELNCIDQQFALDMRIPFQPTNARAKSAGSHKIALAGVTDSDVIFYADFHGKRIPVNLQRVVVVESLGTSVLLGEPAKKFNGIETNATKRTISIRYDGQLHVKNYHDRSRKSFDVARVSTSSTVLPGEQLALPVPARLSGDRVYLVTPGKKDQWYEGGFYPAGAGGLSIRNSSGQPVSVSKKKPVGDIRTCTEVNISKIKRQSIAKAREILDKNSREGLPVLYFDTKDEDTAEATGEGVLLHQRGRPGLPDVQQRPQQAPQPGKKKSNQSSATESTHETESKSEVARLVSYPSSDFRYHSFATPEEPGPWKEPEVIMDPDNIMPDWAKRKMREITNRYAHLFTRRPGKYNGAYGRVDNTINFATPPAPNTKVYVPDYSEKMKQEQAKLMDKLVDFGVLQRPEDIGVVPEVVSPSLLVPKVEPGEFRLVTDFSALNKHIKKYQSTSPTISEAKKTLSRAKYYVHLDFSHFFFQSGIKRSDAQYLGTFHPFKGLLCYVCMPQGIRNASELGYEVLSRVYGEMCQANKCTRAADSLFPQGNSWQEVCDNYEESLFRADKAGLTFKPGKVVICPKNITLFGWDLKGSQWTPTDHTTSALSKAELPSTVRKLRGFLGSFKQYSECVEKYGEILHELEKVVGGKASAEKIIWTDELKKVFNKAKEAAADITGVHVPIPSDKLNTYSDYSADTRAVGGRLEIIRVVDGKKKTLHGGYFSVILDKFKESWVPCEAEAAGVRLTLLHFEKYIRESDHVTTHHTDNLPTVQAWRRCLQGHFSASSRISTFLTNLSALPVEIVYKPGKTMFYSDWSSRHPVPCTRETKCQICGFAEAWQKIGDNASALRSVDSISIKDVLEGRVMMPYIQVKSWLGAQVTDRPHIELKKCIESGQVPDKRKTKGDNTTLKKLYGLYRAGDLTIRRDGLVMIRSRDGHFEGYVISVPTKIMAGIAFSIHIKLGHPSKGQLAALMGRYFFCPGGLNIIHSVVDNCVQCRSIAQVPKSFAMDITEQVTGFGTEFAVDVIERYGQRIFLAREKLSQHTWLELIPDQTTSTFRKVLVRTILPWAHGGGAAVRCDGATALVSLAREAEQEDSLLKQFNIKLEVGRLNNVNKNAVAENAVKECEKEILKYKRHEKSLTEEDLVVIAKTMNERIRNRGMAAKEIFTRRDLVTNNPKNVKDSDLSKEQFNNRLSHNTDNLRRKGDRITSETIFHQGDVVYIKSQLSKHQARERYLVTRFEEGMIVVQKLQSKFGNKEYVMFEHELMPATAQMDELYTSARQQEDIANMDNEDQPVYTDPPDTDHLPPVRRGRGRPRKTPAPPPTASPTTNTRPSRDSAVRARNLFRNLDLERVELEPLRKQIYRNPRVEYNAEQDVMETKDYILNVRQYWAQRDRNEPHLFPPSINYSIMEDEDWSFPRMEDWVELQPAEQPVNVQELQDLLLTASPHGSDGSESGDESETEDETEDNITASSSRRPRLQLAQLARHPESHGQVNTNRVCNLDNLPAVEIDGDNQTQQAASSRNIGATASRQSNRTRSRPKKYDGFQLN